MSESKRSMQSTWTDSDDAPELGDEFFQRADFLDGDKVVRRGRPKSAAPNVLVSLRIPPDVLARWKETGPGWQTRMVASLKNHAPS
ncbi:BrnA antitoxin family protein [Pusillimonas sp. CC-YST705]|uniref:BrnA antitoxin family protein n=1 Tax=Mesopusillimonas faecipullorum TaxID=2755040 RepID=A0ABS8C9G2_9BURK|nr:BrnA antitoxin family protein [Mesopusillimonas faecipullorum]MCB5362673.1 BrnA antitoxin family protein [Mesopusillimonas faecipullorum]